MVFRVFAVATVLCAYALVLALLEGDGKAALGAAVGVLYFGYPTCRVLAVLIDLRYGLFGGRQLENLLAPGRTARAGRPRLGGLLDHIHIVIISGLSTLALLLLLA